MKRILSVTFPELEHLTGVFTKSVPQLLSQFPSADALRRADSDLVADLMMKRSWGKKTRAEAG